MPDTYRLVFAGGARNHPTCWLAVFLLLLLGTSTLAQPVTRVRPPLVQLSNGLKVLGYEDRSTSLVGVFLALKVSAQAEGEELRGARDMIQEAFRFRLEQELRGDPRYLDLTAALLVGRGLSLGTEWDYLSVLSLCPRSELRPLLQVMGKVIFREPLTPEALAAARRALGRQWLTYQSNPAEATFYLFRRALLGPDVGVQPVFADPQRLDSFSPAALEAFRAQYFVAANALLVLAGPDQPEQLVAEAVEAMVSAPRRPAPTGWPPHFSLQPGSVQIATSPFLRRGEAVAASLMVGFRLPPAGDEDYPAALVLFEMLTGKQGLLLSNEKLREAMALPAGGCPPGVPSPLQVLGPLASAVPYLAVHVQTTPEQVGVVHAALRGAFGDLARAAGDPGAVQRAKRRALSAQALAGLDQSGRARRLGEWALFAPGWQNLESLPRRIQAVKTEDLARVIKRCLAREYVGLQMPE